MVGTPRSISYLEARFETGDIPTQQDFYDLFASFLHYLNIVQTSGTSLSQVMSQKAVTDLLALKLDAASYNNHFKGKFTTLGNLQAAFPSAADGDYAIVDAGAGSDAKEYLWDANEGWVLSSGTAVTDTDSITEGLTNLYFTATRVLAAVITGFSAGAGTVSATDTLLQALNKIVGNIALKAPIASPTFTGNPAAPTQSPGNNSTRLATTAYADTAVATLAQDSVTLSIYKMSNFGTP